MPVRRSVVCDLETHEASTSVLAPYAGASEYEHQGERVVRGQRLMQSASDAFLGWVTGTGKRAREFYVRQLRDMKGSAVIEAMPPARLARYGELCGATLARACPQWRRREDRRLSRRRRHVRPCDRTLRRRLRRPERRRLRGVHGGSGRGPHRGRTRRVALRGPSLARGAASERSRSRVRMPGGSPLPSPTWASRQGGRDSRLTPLRSPDTARDHYDHTRLADCVRGPIARSLREADAGPCSSATSCAGYRLTWTVWHRHTLARNAMVAVNDAVVHAGSAWKSS